MTKTPSHNRPLDLPAAIEAQRQELLTKLQLKGIAPEERTSAADAIESDPDTWRRAVLPRWYQKPDGFFHKKAWRKIWGVTDDPLVAPPPLLLPWSRYFGKSSVIRGGAVALAARRRRRFFLYFGAVQESADKHVVNIARMLQTQEMARYYPDLANPMLSQVTGSQVSWSRQQVVTRAGVVFVALGLESAARGINWEEIRPDVIILDDLDKLRDSVQVVQNKIEVLGSDIFPAGQDNTWIVFAQNVIHSQSVMRRTLDGTSGILIDHEPIGPVPAVYGLEYEKRIDAESGKARFFITAGRASWPEGFPLKQAEVKLNQSGPLRFEREYQHNTDILPAGAIYPGYNPLVHVVTYSELAAAFAARGVNLLDGQGRLLIPYHYNKAMGLDFGTTDEHPTAIKWVTTPPEFEPFGPTDKRAGLVIWYRERTMPKYPHLPGEKQDPVSPLRVARVIRDAEGPGRESYAMKLRVMSHEQSAALNTFNFDFDEKTEAETLPTEFKGLGFVKVRPDRWGGISTMQNFFDVDYSQPNQFRRYPAGYKVLDPNSGEQVDLSGTPVPGRVRMIFAVTDGQGELYVDDTGALKVTSATDDDGMIRSRAERMQYTEKVNQSGDSARFPNDFFNDHMDAERNVPAKAIEAGILFVAAALAPEDVRHEHEVARTRPGLTAAAIAARSPGEREGAMVARAMYDRYLERQRAEADAAGSAIGSMYEERRR